MRRAFELALFLGWGETPERPAQAEISSGDRHCIAQVRSSWRR
jgi:hypothetical protein